MEHLVQSCISLFSGLNKDITVFIISMIPILELRGGLIASSFLDIPMLKGIILCVLGNMLPIPFILLFITKIFDALRATKLFKPLVEKLEAKAMDKSEQIQKYEFIGLVLFVGIPLPGTGAWTGSLIAALLGVRLKKSIPAVICGILLAAFIMTIVSYGVPALVNIIR